MIARKSALIVFTNIINALLGYVALFFITRYMEPGEYGIVAFALGFVTLFSIFGNLGFNLSHVKRLSEGKNLGKCNGTFFSVKFVLSFLMIFATLISIFIWKSVLGRGFESTTHEMAIYILIIYWAIRTLSEAFIFTFKAKKEIAKAQIPNSICTIFRVGFTLYVAISNYGPLALAFSYVIGEIASFLISLYFFRGYPVKKPTKEYFVDYSKFAIPCIIVVASTLIMTNIDKVLIQLFWSSTDVGYYFASFNLSKFVEAFTLAIGILLFPTYSFLHSKKNINGIRDLTYKSERYLSMIVFPIVFGLMALAQPAALILLSGWMPAVPILQILPLYALFDALSRPYSSQVIGMDRPDIARNRVIIMVSVNIVLNLILIPRDISSIGLTLFGLGMKGAAIATVIAYGVGLIYNRIVAMKLTKMKGNPRILLHLFAAMLMGVILYYLDSIFVINRWYTLVGFGFFGFSIYFGILYIMREFTIDELKFFIDTLSVKKMMSYIIKEIRNK